MRQKSVGCVWRQTECEFLKRNLLRLRKNPYRRLLERGDKTDDQTYQLPINVFTFRYDPTVGYAGDKSVDFGTMDTICQYCSSLRFRLEPTWLYCANGKVKLPQLTSPPEPLNSLLLRQEHLSKHFLQNIQNYNCVFQITSVGANIIEERGFHPTLKVLISSVTNIIHIHSNI